MRSAGFGWLFFPGGHFFVISKLANKSGWFPTDSFISLMDSVWVCRCIVVDRLRMVAAL